MFICLIHVNQQAIAFIMPVNSTHQQHTTRKVVLTVRQTLDVLRHDDVSTSSGTSIRGKIPTGLAIGAPG